MCKANAQSTGFTKEQITKQVHFLRQSQIFLMSTPKCYLFRHCLLKNMVLCLKNASYKLTSYSQLSPLNTSQDSSRQYLRLLLSCCFPDILFFLYKVKLISALHN